MSQPYWKQQNFNTLADHWRRAGKEELVLFTGAGTGHHAVDDARRPVQLPLGRQLAERLAAEVGLEYKGQPLSELAEYVLIKTKDRGHLLDLLADWLGHNKSYPDEVFKAMVLLPVHCFVTANYDVLLEEALRATSPSSEPPDVWDGRFAREPRADGRSVYKVHGSLGRPDTILVTDSDFEKKFGTSGINLAVVNRVRALLSDKTLYLLVSAFATEISGICTQRSERNSGSS